MELATRVASSSESMVRPRFALDAALPDDRLPGVSTSVEKSCEELNNDKESCGQEHRMREGVR